MAAGSGLTFNDGEYVEGCTSLAWPLLIGAGAAMGWSPPEFSLVLNVLLLCLIPVLMLWLGRRLGFGQSAMMFSGAMYLLALPFFKVVYLGLEFGLYAAGLLLFMGLCVSRWTARSALRIGLCAGALFAIRPDSLPLLPGVIIILLWLKCSEPDFRAQAGKILLSLLPFGFMIGAISAWRLYYYGALLPNSVIAKSLSPFAMMKDPRETAERFIAAAHYLLDAYLLSPAIVVAIAALIIMVLKRDCPKAYILGVPVVLQHVIVLVNGGDWMPYYRFIYILIPLLIVSFGVCANVMWKQGIRIFALSLFVLTTGIGAWNFGYFKKAENPLIAAYGRIGTSLNSHWIPGDILSAEAIGQIGFLAPAAYIHDPLGLTDNVLSRDKNATRSVYGRSNWAYTLQLRPKVLITHGQHDQKNWAALGTDYPDQYAFFGIDIPGRTRPLCIALHRDRLEAYAAAILSTGALTMGENCERRLAGLGRSAPSAANVQGVR